MKGIIYLCNQNLAFAGEGKYYYLYALFCTNRIIVHTYFYIFFALFISPHCLNLKVKKI